jgi:hypothetical protein
MTAIWRYRGSEWSLAEPAGFPDEASLHALVEQAPQVLPLSGSPSIVVVGREVRLGNGYADLVALEASGTPVIIEVKLAYNSEARRAVVTQVLTYAAYLFGLDAMEFERRVLGRHLAERGFGSLSDAVAPALQEVDEDFDDAISQSLAKGRLRLVIVLDEAPRELVELVGFLEAVTDHLTIDLVTVAQYELAGERVVVPQRIDPGRVDTDQPARRAGSDEDTFVVEGVADFLAVIDQAPAEQRPLLRKLAEWAQRLDQEGLVKLETYHGKRGITTLLPRLKSEGAGLVTIYKDSRSGYLQFWRSLFSRRAPHGLARVEELLGPGVVGQGTTSRDIDDELLDALSSAYREAAAGGIPTKG